MTINPPCLLAVRVLLASPLGLPPVELGIAGDTAHVSEGDSYHLGRPEQDPRGSYSVCESPRDRAGLCGYASALDVGYWSRGGHDLRSMSVWMVEQCRRGAPDTKDIREIIYSPDGRTVRRWDRLGRRSTGDSSHRTHTHFSFFRDATKAGRDQRPLFARYMIEIGLIEGDGDMTPEQEAMLARIDRNTSGTSWSVGRGVKAPEELHTTDEYTAITWYLPVLLEYLRQIAGKAGVSPDEVRQITAGIAGALPTAPDIVAGVLAGLSPEAIAAAIPPTLAQQVVNQLAARLAGDNPAQTG